ncbi:ribonuclease H [Halobacteriales archaeon SW_12_69_24]|nr:MAG: ribonuclease H [Halobacteriales archaeon SW_12_69_24]
MPVIDCDPEAAREQLEVAGVEVAAGNTEHERWRASHAGATAVAYDDTVVVQGEAPARLVGLLDDAGGRAHLYFDGGARGNPGEAAVGWVLVTAEGIAAEAGDRIGRATNNQAEYEALVRGLEAAVDYGFEELVVRGDSELVVRQVRGEYDTNDPTLREKRVRVRELLAAVEEWTIEHVPREINDRADELLNDALDG